MHLCAVGLPGRSRRPSGGSPAAFERECTAFFPCLEVSIVGYLVLARKYRPQHFEEVVGQEAIAKTLKNAIDQGRVAHAYLFVGQRGVGKTTMARIFAKALNCERGPTGDPCGNCESCVRIARGDDVDVVEIDGASNRKIENARDIRENAKYRASHSRFKIYYIDEVHQLTPDAFNALLKTLEEPPPHVKFIFATTEAHKLPATILSRCQRFDFRPIPQPAIEAHLAALAKKEKVKIEDAALRVIARRGDGSMRDSQTLLDQLISFSRGKITLQDVYDVVGAVGAATIDVLVAALVREDGAAVLDVVDRVIAEGKDLGEFLRGFMESLRELMVARAGGDNAASLREGLREAADWSLETVLYMMSAVSALEREIRRGNRDRALIEMVLVKLSRVGDLAPMGELVARVEALSASPSSVVAPAPDSGGATRAASPRRAEAAPGSPWAAVLGAVKEVSPRLYGKLSTAGLSRIDEESVVLCCRPWLRKYLEDERPREQLIACMRDVLGKELRVEFADDAGAPRESEGSPMSRPLHRVVERARDFIPGEVISQKGERDG